MLFLKKDRSPSFRTLENKYGEDDYKELQMLILMIFVKISRIILKLLNFEFHIS
jgi:hypothetical protein